MSKETFRNLYMARANPTIKDNEDRTPIHLAAERGHTNTVEFLADKFKVGGLINIRKNIYESHSLFSLFLV